MRPAATDELVIKTSFGYHALRLSDIEYAEARNKHVVFHLRDGRDIEALEPFRSIEDQLAQHATFFKCHRSYQVNLRNIDHFNRTEDRHALGARASRWPAAANRGSRTPTLRHGSRAGGADAPHGRNGALGNPPRNDPALWRFCLGGAAPASTDRCHSLELVATRRHNRHHSASPMPLAARLRLLRHIRSSGHLPLIIYLCVRYRASPLLAMLGVTSAYLSCQFSNWMGIAALAATGSQSAYDAARIITTAGALQSCCTGPATSVRAWRSKNRHPSSILLILPLVDYIFDYATNVHHALPLWLRGDG